MFLPATTKEMRALGWDRPDIILVNGDAHIDSPFIGVAVIGKVLLAAGYRVGIIAQPDITSDRDIARLGEPRLFWGVSGGCIDSMVANYTASGKKRKQDDYTPGGINNRRPDRAVIIYANLIRRYFKNTRPIVLGGIEASLRRISHYDFWSDSVRRSILFDARGDYLLYGMAERAVVELANRLDAGKDPRRIRGVCYAASTVPAGYEELPSHAEAAGDKAAFTAMFRTFYDNNDPVTAAGLAQRQDSRYLIQNPPAPWLTTEELDRVHNLDYERDLHPHDRRRGRVRALATIRFAIATHRGCYGECNFCAIAVHQGRTVRRRSRRSILREAEVLTRHPRFTGIIADVGGPTANMYGFECSRKAIRGSCRGKRCLYPRVCAKLPVNHEPQLQLLRQLRQLPGIRKVIVASGIRHDLLPADQRHGTAYLRQLVRHHVSGQLKLAPEHSEKRVLAAMGKPGTAVLLSFRRLFNRLTREAGKKQFLTYYMIAAHPDCSLDDMRRLRNFSRRHLRLLPRQVQIFTPTPSTWSTLMYWTGRNPFTGKPCLVEKSFRGRRRQKNCLLPSTDKDSGRTKKGVAMHRP